MASIAADRQEARRRKILENSEKRLKYISGKETEPLSNGSTTVKNTQLQDIIDAPYISSPDFPIISRIETPEPYVRHEDPEIETLTSADLFPNHKFTNQPQKIVKQKPNIILSSKLDILLCSILMQLLYHCSYLREDTNLILLLIAYSTIKIFFWPPTVEAGLAQTFLIMNGIEAGSARKLIQTSQMLKHVLEDIFIFIFFTIAIQTVLYLFL